MLYGLTAPKIKSELLPKEDLVLVPEERKQTLPKCDICKVTIKKADTITVKCSGFDKEIVQKLNNSDD